LNLKNGEYQRRSVAEGLGDFLGQLRWDNPERHTRPEVEPSTFEVLAQTAMTAGSLSVRVGVAALNALISPDSGVSSSGVGGGGGNDVTIELWDNARERITRASRAAVAVSLEATAENKANAVRKEKAIPRLHYTLLRRGKEYDVRRYSRNIVAASSSGEDSSFQISRYLGGANIWAATLVPFSPSLVTFDGPSRVTEIPLIAGDHQTPMDRLPEPLPSISSVVRLAPLALGEYVVAVRRLPPQIPGSTSVENAMRQASIWSDERSVLLKALAADKLAPVPDAPMRIAMYSEAMPPVSSEIWVPLAVHEWS
jgi:hypothetical protein